MKEDFYKSIKENLENRPEPAFREPAWEAMEQQLIDAEQVVLTPVWIGKLAVPLLLLFLGMSGSNFWLFQQLQTEKNNQLLVQTDTIYNSQVIIQTDTIYQTKLINQIITVNQNRINAPTLVNKEQRTFQNPSAQKNLVVHRTAIQSEIQYLRQKFERLATPILSTNWEKSSMNHSRSSNNGHVLNGAILNSSKTIRQSLNREALKTAGNSPPIFAIGNLPILTPMFYIPLFNNSPLKVTVPFVKRKTTIGQRVYQMRPKTFHLGVLGGMVIANHADLDDIGGYTFGLNATVGFSSNFRLWGEAAFMKLEYSSTNIDPALGIPTITPPQDNLEFEEAEVTQPAYQFGAGVQYLFNAHKQWKPYLGVGYGVVALVPHEVSYEFSDPSTDIEFKLIRDVQRNELLRNQLLLKTGLAYEFSNRWTVLLEGMYRKGDKNMDLNPTNVWSVRSGLSYKF